MPKIKQRQLVCLNGLADTVFVTVKKAIWYNVRIDPFAVKL